MSRPSIPSRSIGGDLHDRWFFVGAAALLAGMVWIAFGGSLQNGFVNYDDNVYLNLTVQRGLTWKGFLWAATYAEIGHWHPLTWLSHMLDCQLFGVWPAGHHLTSMVLHGASTILLFLLLARMTGRRGRSFLVAAFFSIHPLRVESVVWISERKDVLSVFFFMLTLLAYVAYVRKPSVVRYLLALLLFALGLLSKDMLVTLPFVCLLLDYWPLQRVDPANFRTRWRRLLVEKIPFFVLSAASSVLTLIGPEKLESDHLNLSTRIGNSLVTYVTYLGQTMYPSGLAALYPMRVYPFWEATLAFVFLGGITWGVLLLGRRRPYLPVGWFWYLGILVPVIGIAQISYYLRADRYTYLAQIGIILMVVWTVSDTVESRPRWRRWAMVVAGMILLVQAVSTRRQVTYWHDSETLWRHALAVTRDNPVAECNLGVALRTSGKTGEAMAHFQRAIALRPTYSLAQNDLGEALLAEGKTDDAIGQFRLALAEDPDCALPHYNLANALASQGNATEAIKHFEQSVKINPDFSDALANLGATLALEGDFDRAIEYDRKAMQADPTDVFACSNLATALESQGHHADASAAYRQALALKPDYVVAHRGLAIALAAQGDLTGAIGQFEAANRLTNHGDPTILDNLACAYANAGRLIEARETASRALTLAEADGDQSLVDLIRSHLNSLP